MNPVDLRLYGIIDPERTNGRDLTDLARQAVAGGATLIQYRDKHAEGRQLVERARALKAALSDTAVPLLINDRIDVALAVEADGVHLGQADMHPRDARDLLGPTAIIGLTIKTREQADELATTPVTYGCIGGVFATESKNNVVPPIGIAGLREIAARARLAGRVPVGAIAGIDVTNAQAAIAAGADGIAVISSLFRADDPRDAAQQLRRLVDDALAMRALPT